ncbi:uncharacterized protein VTP21DRAFT_8256 [Calcarisporiella thermophila]|uniref:uncharacterized protein n=1 Tax=Calcarisporiella thermophila TaxID=911321 RepID=UPI0037429FF4
MRGLGAYRLLLVAAFALTAIFLAEAAVLSIDYGTEWFKVGLVKPNFDVALNRDSKRKTASIVTLRGRERIYGSDSLNLASRFPESTFPHLKRILGRHFDDAHAQSYRSAFTPEMIKTDRNTIAFKQGNEIFTVEELVAMQFSHAREQAEATAQETIRDAVITVPPFFNQFERQAILDAAELAELNVLSLIHDETAVALNYAMSRSFSSEPEYHIFYDMGAGSTVASLVGFRTVSVRDIGKYNKTVTEIEVRGVGYDRTLGGGSFDERMLRFIGEEFDRVNKGKLEKSVFENPRAIAKLKKEATRVKEILSANTEMMASIEGLHEDRDFRMKVTRADLERLSKDLLKRVMDPINIALKNANVDLSSVKSLVLVGGGIRIPAIQNILKEAVGKDRIAKNVNQDEAAVLGAALRAAGLSRQYRVKEFRIKDIHLFPIEVRYKSEPKENSQESKVSHTTLFPGHAALDAKKIVTFKRTGDFDIDVKYTELSEDTMKDFPTTDIAQARISGLANVLQKFNETAILDRPKVKVTLELTGSGLVTVTDAVASIEVEDRSTLVDKVKSLLSGNNQTSETESEKLEETPSNEEKKQGESNATNSETNASESSNKKHKIETLPLNVSVVLQGIPPMPTDIKNAASKRLREMDTEDLNRRMREESRNRLEAFVYTAQDFLSHQLVSRISTEEERATLKKQLEEASEWLYGDGEHATVQQFTERWQRLQALHHPIQRRKEEVEQRPTAIEGLKRAISDTNNAIDRIGQLQSTLAEDMQKDIQSRLDKVREQSKVAATWLEEKISKQSQLAENVDPILWVGEIVAKASELERGALGLLKKVANYQASMSKSTASTTSSSSSTSSSSPTSTTVEQSNSSSTKTTTLPTHVKDEL